LEFYIIHYLDYSVINGYQTFINKLINDKLLVINYFKEGTIKRFKSAYKRKDSYRILISLWDLKIESSNDIKGARTRVDKIANIVNGLGTVCVSSFFALLIWLISHFTRFNGFNLSHIILLFVYTIFLTIQFLNFKMVVNDFETLVETILYNNLYKSKVDNKPSPFILMVK